MNYDESLKIYNDYYKTFDGKLDEVNEKFNHTFRVVEYAKRIAESLELSNDDIDLAIRCALFHDIARFKQWSEYKTFSDKLSFDHGDEGYNILKELGINDEVILLSTKYHNKYEVGDVDDRTKLFAYITRDADKLDILMTQEKKCRDTELIIDDYVIDSIRNKRLINTSNVTVSSDVVDIFRCIAFIFDMKYKESFKILKETNIINDKFNIILSRFDNEIIKELKSICNEYIEERLSE